jgi:hypothetical protein
MYGDCENDEPENGRSSFIFNGELIRQFIKRSIDLIDERS